MQSSTFIARRSSFAAVILAVIGLFFAFAIARGVHAEPPAQAAATGGVGLALHSETENDPTITINGLLPGGPGEKAGVQVGDLLTAVEGEAVTINSAGPRLRGAPGSTVKITVSRGGKPMDFTLTRAALNLPPAGPNVPGAGPANPGPVGPGAAPGAAAGANGLPAFLQPGFRLSWIGGNSTLAGKHKVPDPNGWFTINGQKYSLVESNRTGGMGFTQLNIIHADPQLIVADLRSFLIVDVEKGICASKSHTLFIGNADALGDYWVNPAKLAGMQEERTDADTITRGTYTQGNRQYKSISIRHQGQDGYSSKTYDLDSGLMLFGGSSDMDPALFITHQDNGQVDQIEGSKTYSHNKLVAVRETKIPWAGAQAPAWLAKGHRFDYTGTATTIQPGVPGLPALPPLPGQATTLSFEVDKELAADCVSVKTLARYDLGRGIPPDERRGTVPFGSAMLGGLWTPPEGLRALQPNQMLDEDPVTRYRISFGGIQGNLALLVEQGPTDLMEMSYDLGSGLRVATRYTSQPEPRVGPMRLEYRLTGKN